MTGFVKTYQRALLAFSVVVLGFTIYGMAAIKPPAPEFYPLGVSAADIVRVYEPGGFTFESSSPVYEQPRQIGEAPDGAALIQLVGPSGNLTGVNVSVYMTQGLPEPTQDLRRSYLDTMISLVLPNWEDGHEWLEEEALSMKRAGSRSTEVGDVKVVLTVASADDGLTLGLSFGAWRANPDYEDGDWQVD